MKRHIVTDTLGCLLAVKVHRANLHDTKAGLFVAINAYRNYPTIQKFSGDGGYKGSFEKDVKAILNIETEISEKIKAKVFHVIPKRWVVERSFAWPGNSRRLAKDFEFTTDSSEAMVKISHCHTLLKRL